MRVIGQAIDEGAVGVPDHVQHRLVAAGANDHDINILAQHANEIGHAFPRAPADIASQKHAAAPQVRHGGLKADAGPQARLLEQQRHHAPGKQRLANALRVLGLEVFGDGEDAFDLRRRQVFDID